MVAGQEAPIALTDTESKDPADLVDLNRMADVFSRCFERVVTEYRELYPQRQQYIELRVIAGLSNSEIEAALGRTPGAIREFVSKCRLKFEALLEKLCGQHAVDAAEDLL